MHKYKIHIAYEGTRYSGWQLQPNALTIQAALEYALQVFLKAPTRVIGAGRTDAGVHALSQVAHFLSDKPLDLRRALYAVNSLLPEDIRVLKIEDAEENFHAQYSATGKIYHYHIWQEKAMHPFYRFFRTHFPFCVSLELMRKAALLFLGNKDFASFTNVGSSAKTTIRTLSRVDIFEQEGGFRFEFEGDGFLYKMVRNIVGTLLEVGIEKRTIAEVSKMFEIADRRVSGRAAPAKGLLLVQVLYPNSLQSEVNESKEEKLFPIS